jgi:hypothetical protein
MKSEIVSESRIARILTQIINSPDASIKVST